MLRFEDCCRIATGQENYLFLTTVSKGAAAAILAEFTLPVILTAVIAELQALGLLLARESAEDTNGIASLEPSLKERAEYGPINTRAEVKRRGKRGDGAAWKPQSRLEGAGKMNWSKGQAPQGSSGVSPRPCPRKDKVQ